MESLAMVLVSALLFRSSDAGSFTWLHSDDTVNVVEGDTAKLNWSVRIDFGRPWFAVKISRSATSLVGAGSLDLIRRWYPSGIKLLMADRVADMDLDVQANLNVLNITFSLRNLSRKADEMYYRITVYDGYFNCSWRTTHLNIYVHSSCKIYPNRNVVAEGTKVSLNVTTTGNPPVYQYIWTIPNGRRLSANSTLTFNASRQDTGTYKVSVYNGVGNRSNCTTDVIVYYRPFPVDPDTTILNKTDVSLNFTTTENPPVHEYIWTYPNGSTVTANSKLTFAVSRQDTGTYNVSVYNGVGDRSICTDNATVQFPSWCKIYPDKTTVNETDKVSLNLITIGYPPVYEYIWTHPNGSRLTANSTLTFTASRQDTGTYNVSVYNGVGERSYCTSNVTVQYKPNNTNISHSPNETTFCLGSLMDITCTSNANPPVEKYSLYRNEEWVQENITGLFKVLLNKTGTSRFTCKPENQIGVGKIKSLTPINVKEPPGISNCHILDNGKERAFAVEGRNVILRCDISGSEPLKKTWTNGQQVWNDNTVTLESVRRGDAGTYNLTVSNGEECNKAETSYYLDVYYVPELTNMAFYPNKITFCRGDQIHVNCTASAKLQANYSLYRNNELVISSRSGIFVVDLSTSGNISFTCVPNNEAGYGQNSSATLEVKGLHPLEVIGSSNKSYSQSNPLVLFNLSINSCPSNTSLSCNPSAPNILTAITSYDDAGLTGKQYFVFVVIQKEVDSASIVCKAENSVGVRERTLHFYRRPIHPKDNSPILIEKLNKILVTVLGVLFGLSIVLNIICITGCLWSRRKASKDNNSGKRSNKSDEMGQINDISFQETSFNYPNNETPNVPEYEPIERRGLSTSNVGIPEYETVITRTRPRQPHSGVQTNNPMPQYESGDQHRQTGASSNPPPVVYQNIQPRTRVPPKGTVQSSTGNPTRTGEYQALQHRGVSPQYQFLDGLNKC